MNNKIDYGSMSPAERLEFCRGKGNSQMVSVPREPTDEMIRNAMIVPVADTGNDDVDEPQDYRNLWKAMIDASPAQQPQDEPVALVDSPRCGASWPQFDSVCGKTKNGNSTWQCGECARKEVAALRTKMEKYFGLYKEADEHVNHWQRQERAKARWAKQAEAERDTLRAQLAERDALLRDRFGGIRKLAEKACGRPKDSPEYRSLIEAINPTMLLDLTALSASAEPSAPKCKCRNECEDCGDDGQTCTACAALERKP